MMDQNQDHITNINIDTDTDTKKNLYVKKSIEYMY